LTERAGAEATTMATAETRATAAPQADTSREPAADERKDNPRQEAEVEAGAICAQL